MLGDVDFISDEPSSLRADLPSWKNATRSICRIPGRHLLRRERYLLTRLCSGLLLLSAAFSAWAQDAPGTGIEERAAVVRSSVENASGLSEEQKTQALARVEESLRFAAEIATETGVLAKLREEIAGAPDALKRLETAAANSPADESPLDNGQSGTEQLEQKLAEVKGVLATRQLSVDERERNLSQLLNQARSGANELAELRKGLAKLREQQGAEPGDNVLASVDGLWRAARIRLLQLRADVIELRLGNIDLLTELARKARDVAMAEVDAVQRRYAALLEIVQQRRQQDAADAVSAAEDQSPEAPSVLKVLQADIAALAREQAQLLAEEAEYRRRLDQVNRNLERIKKDYDRIQQAVELGGSSTQISSLLQKRRRLAPSPERLGREVLAFQQLLSDAGLRQLEIDEQLQEFIDDREGISSLVESKGFDFAAIASAGQGDAVREVVGIFRQTALDLWQSYTRYLNVVSQLEANTLALTQEARRYQAFIEDRLLWVPSTAQMPLDQPGLLIDGLQWFVQGEHLTALATDLLRLPSSRTVVLTFWLLVGIVLLLLRRPALRRLAQCAEATRRVRTDRFSLTLMALFHTLVLIALVPWFLIGGGLLIGKMADATNTTLIYAAGLQAAGHVILFLGVLRHICRSNGLGLAHLRWHPSLCENLGRQAAWLMPIGAPLAFFGAAGTATVTTDFINLSTAVQIEDIGLVAIGRLSFVARMVLLMYVIHRVWRKGGAVISAFAESVERAKWAQYHILWFGPALMIPFALILSAAMGYFYSAVFVTAILGKTLWFIIAAVLAKDLLLRGLYVTKRQLRFQEALRYRDESIAQREAANEGGDTPVDSAIHELEERKVDYNELGDQARSLVQLGFTLSIIGGLWWIWADVFPALGFLKAVELPITTSRLIDGVTQEVPLTLSDMVAGLLLGGLALFAAVKVPAVLELTLLQRLPMSRASRYAITTMSQYIVAMIGVFITFKSLGLQWSSIQWLVAALSVGLGFGLQEIVANFISGIILLFEQPIRVGDVVTVDGTTGTVSRIRIRATTIVSWERQELVIPNKSFITGQLINWTLSDTVNRVMITVGVGYDTDTRLAMQLMHEVAEEHPNVMSDPVHRISFEGFGDNALTLNMRAFLGNIETRLQTISELHQAILDKFREAGIEIAFPQRDVHLSTSAPLELHLSRQPGGLGNS